MAKRYIYRVQTEQERFWGKVLPTETCWLWLGSRSTGGYGQITIRRKLRPAHRWVYEELVGAIPDGLVLDHLCRTRHCVNPSHLEPTTQRTNILRGTGVAARYAKREHCTNGHLLKGETVRRLNKRGRLCLLCQRQSEASRPQRKRIKGRLVTLSVPLNTPGTAEQPSGSSPVKAD